MTPRFPIHPILLAFTFLAVVGPAVAGRTEETAKRQTSTESRPTAGGTANGAATDLGPFEAREFRDAKGRVLPYRLLEPAKLERGAGARKVPLFVFLHGLGERGDDNRAQLFHGRAFLRAAARRHGALVVVPQCPLTDTWSGRMSRDKDHSLLPEPNRALRLVVELIYQIKKDYPVDVDRVYVGGLSMGGFGTWELLARWPGVFAAAVPICGGGDESRAKAMAKVAVWAFHGDADPVVPVARSRDMVRAIRDAGGGPRYTEYKGVGHDSWNRTLAEPALLKWLFDQRRESGTADECR